MSDYRTAKKALEALENHKPDFIHGFALDAINELEQKLETVCAAGVFRDDYDELGVVEGLSMTMDCDDFESRTFIQLVKAPHMEAVRECVNQRFDADDNGTGGMGADCTGRDIFYRGEISIIEDGAIYAITQRVSVDC